MCCHLKEGLFAALLPLMPQITQRLPERWSFRMNQHGHHPCGCFSTCQTAAATGKCTFNNVARITTADGKTVGSVSVDASDVARLLTFKPVP